MPLLLRKTIGTMTVPVHHARGALYRKMRTDGLALAPQQNHWESLKTPPLCLSFQRGSKQHSKALVLWNLIVFVLENIYRGQLLGLEFSPL